MRGAGGARWRRWRRRRRRGTWTDLVRPLAVSHFSSACCGGRFCDASSCETDRRRFPFAQRPWLSCLCSPAQAHPPRSQRCLQTCLQIFFDHPARTDPYWARDAGGGFARSTCRGMTLSSVRRPAVLHFNKETPAGASAAKGPRPSLSFSEATHQAGVVGFSSFSLSAPSVHSKLFFTCGVCAAVRSSGDGRGREQASHFFRCLEMDTK